MKGYTDLEQSKKLAEILPIESADMWFANGIVVARNSVNEPDDIKSVFPCWSLAALLNYLRKIDFFPEIEVDEHGVKMSVSYYNEEEVRLLAPVHTITVMEESFIDACYELILKLHEF